MIIATKEDGFSLIEMAMVLVIIGLCLAGILKGQELLESARLKSVLTQVNSYRLATTIFYDRYGSLPGDFNQAKELIAPSLKNGNNDGRITGPGLSNSLNSGDHEALSFWSHLAEAGLISSPGTSSNKSTQDHFNQGAPSSKVGGGFTVQYAPDTLDGHWFMLGEENGNQGDGPLLTPLQALTIDKKADNGDPLSGNIQARNGKGAHHKGCIKNNTYNLENKEAACILYFRF